MQSAVAERKSALKNNLAALRGKRSVRDVAQAIGVTRKTIYDAETGAISPKLNTLAALIKYYGSPVVYDLDQSEK